MKLNPQGTGKSGTGRTKETREWPRYMLWGRIRTSTVVMLIAFVGIWWLYEEYRPVVEPAPAPATQVVPPGFIPDPSYTWVPRTEVQTRTYTTTTPTMTSEPETTAPSDAAPTTSGSTTPTTTPTSPTTTTSGPSTTPTSAPSSPSTTTTSGATSSTPTSATSTVPGTGPRATPAAPTQ